MLVEVVAPGAAVNLSRPSDPDSDSNVETRGYIRGSGLLLGGRLISILLNLAVQILTVRYLSKSDFGAFAYALGIASIGSSLVLVGLGKAVPRFVPIYAERGDHARAFGTIVLSVAAVLGLGLALVVFLFGLRGLLAATVVTDTRALALLLVLIALAPINALDHLLQNLVAVFTGARAIFFRRHVLGPGLKLVAVLGVIAIAGDVYVLAYGYLAGGLVGIWLYCSILIREWRKQDLLRYLHPHRLRFPVRELFGFSIPLLSAELPVLSRGALPIFFLEYFQTTTAVADYRAVYPIAALNLIVFQSFGLLYVPVAARMFARGQQERINDLYWKTSIWIAVLTFPVFAVTCSLATPISVLLFGPEYRAAGIVLAVLGVGYYVNAALGFNAETLRVSGRIRFLVASDLVAVTTFALLCLLLIPLYGAIGAAIAATANLIVHNVANQVGLWLGGTGIRLVEGRFVKVCSSAMAMLLALLLLQWLTAPPLYLGIGLAALASVMLLRLTRHLVGTEEIFPELLRIPLLRRLLT